MTFESMIENNPVATESVPLKVAYGNDLRRATFIGNSFEHLSEVVAKLFGLEQGSFFLKYQDDDNDKITMSSDGEVQDALKLTKEKNLLRLFVELKAQAPPLGAEQPAFIPYERNTFPHRGGFPHHPRGPHGAPRGFGYGGPHSGHFGQGPFNGPSFHGPFRGGHHYGHGFRGPFGCAPAAPTTLDSANLAPAESTTQQPDGTSFRTFHQSGNGSFAPAGQRGPWGARCAFKEHKRAMKEQIQLMKENAATKDDKIAIKEFKQQMMAECMRAKWQEKMERTGESNGKWQEKMEKKHGEKWNEKWQEKMKKKHGENWAEKWEEKMQKKQRKMSEKKCDKERKHGDRLVAKHVADVTVPDNSLLPADTPVTKTWKLRNAGLTAWPASAQLVFISKKGDNLNGPEKVPVGAVQPGQEVDVSVTFITPSEAGRYIGYYRMASAEGAKFGQRVWVSFIIPAASDVNTTTVTAATAQLSLNNSQPDLLMD